MSRRIFLFTSTIAQAPDVVCFPDHTKGLGTLGSSAHTGQLARRVARFYVVAIATMLSHWRKQNAQMGHG